MCLAMQQPPPLQPFVSSQVRTCRAHTFLPPFLCTMQNHSPSCTAGRLIHALPKVPKAAEVVASASSASSATPAKAAAKASTTQDGTPKEGRQLSGAAQRKRKREDEEAAKKVRPAHLVPYHTYAFHASASFLTIPILFMLWGEEGASISFPL